MLAAHLQRLSRPVRYAAMDPAHAAAIRNYLALTTRGYDVPRLYQQARPHLPGGREGELLHHLFSAMIGEHDPDALAQFLDAHQDFTGEPMAQPGDAGHLGHPGRRLLQTLAAIQHTVGDHPGFAFPGRRRPNYMHAFSPGRLADPSIHNAVRQEYHNAGYGVPLAESVASLQHYLDHGIGGQYHVMPAMPERAAALGDIRRGPGSLSTGDPMSLVRLLDLTHAVQHDPAATQPTTLRAHHAENRSRQILQDNVIQRLLNT